MSSSNLIRWGGMAAVIAGGILAVASLPELGAIGEARVRGWAGSRAMGSGLILLSVQLVLLGLLGLYLRRTQVSRTIVGLIIFPAASLAAVLVVGVGAGWVQAFVVDTMEQDAKAVLTSLELAGGIPAESLPAKFTLSFALVAAAWALFGVATFRSLVDPQTAAMFLLAGAVLILSPLLLPLPVAYIALSVYAASLGLALFLRRNTTVQQTRRTE